MRFQVAFGVLALLQQSSCNPTLLKELSHVNREAQVIEWGFSCYAMNEDCVGNTGTSGATKAGGVAAVGCSPISGSGCTRFKYKGNDAWRLCVYSSRDCTGNIIDGRNGANEDRCIDINGPQSYKIVAVNAAC